MFCVACWVPWIFFTKLGADEIPARTMQFLFNLGGIPLAVIFLIVRRFRIEKSPKGIMFGLIVGVLSAVGQLAMFAAYQGGSNASVVTVLTSLYPAITFSLAFVFLRERLAKVQVVGLVLALVALALFSV